MKSLFTLIFLTVLAIPFLHSQNNPPIAINDTLYINFNDSLVFTAPGPGNLYLNDSDPNNDNLFIDTVIYYGFGNFLFSKVVGSFIRIAYKPPFNFIGIDSAFYILKDNGNPIMYDTATIYFYVKHPEFENLDLNNTNATIGLYDFFHNRKEELAGYETPKGSGLNTFFLANLWVVGKNQDTICLNAETKWSWNISNSIMDFSSPSGPIMDSMYYQKYSYKWDRLWKINNWDINYHINNWNTIGYQATEVITNWPAHGDTSKGQTYYLAPFIDNNNDGVYNPYDGDYPKIKGQQAIYRIYNNHRHTDYSSGPPLLSEVHCMAYAYNCPSDSAIYNTIFLDFTIYNRSNLLYDSTYVGLWTDMDIGNNQDDFMGSDVDRSSFYGYNGDNFDEDINGIYGYQAHPPAQSVTFLKGAKQDNDGIDNNFGINTNETINGLGFGDNINDNEYWGMEHFMSYRDQQSCFGPNSTLTYNTDFYNLLKSNWLDESKAVWGGNGNSLSTGGTLPVKYLYPNNSDNYWYNTGGLSQTPWTEITVPNSPAEREAIGSTGPFTFEPDSSIEITLALVFGRDYQNTGNTAGIIVMQERIDSIRSYYLNDFTNTACGLALSIDKNKVVDNLLTIYPNPFNNQISINYELINSQAQLKVYNGFGKLVKEVVLKNKQTTIDLTHQSNGIYFIQLSDGKNRLTKKVVKQ